MKDKKLLLLLGALNCSQVDALKLQSQSEMLLGTTAEVVLDAETGTEVLSDAFLNAEVAQEAKMIAQQEIALEAQEEISEQETNKFIEITNQKDEDDFETAEALAQKEVETEKNVHEFKPNVYENFDATTGKKIEEPQQPNTNNQEFQVESDHLYDSFKVDDNADQYLANFNKAAPVVEAAPVKVEQKTEVAKTPAVDPAADLIANLKKQMEGVSLEPVATNVNSQGQITGPVAPVSQPVIQAKVDPAAELIANLKKQMEGVSLEPTATGEKGENSLGIPQVTTVTEAPRQSLAQDEQQNKPEDVAPVKLNNQKKDSPILIDDGPADTPKPVEAPKKVEQKVASQVQATRSSQISTPEIKVRVPLSAEDDKKTEPASEVKKPEPVKTPEEKKPEPVKAEEKKPEQKQSPLDKQAEPVQAPEEKKPEPVKVPVEKKPEPAKAPEENKPETPKAPVEEKPVPAKAPVEAKPVPAKAPVEAKPVPAKAPVEAKPVPAKAPVEKKSEPAKAPEEKKPETPKAPVEKKPETPKASEETKPESPKAPEETKPETPKATDETKPETPKAADEKKPVPAKKTEEKKTEQKTPESTKKADSEKTPESAKKAPEQAKLKIQAPVSVQIVHAPVANKAKAPTIPAKVEDASKPDEKKSVKTEIIIESIPTAATDLAQKKSSKLKLSNLISDLEEASFEPTYETTDVPKAKQPSGPAMMIFDSKKPIANAPEGTIKTTMKSDLIPMQGDPLPTDVNNVETQCKNGDKGCQRVPNFVKEKEVMLAVTEKQHTVTKPVQGIALPEAGIKIREPATEKIDLTVFQKKTAKSDQKLSSIMKNLDIPQTSDLISELEDMSMVQTSSKIETKTESAEKTNEEGIQEEQPSGFKLFMRNWFKITW